VITLYHLPILCCQNQLVLVNIVLRGVVGNVIDRTKGHRDGGDEVDVSVGFHDVTQLVAVPLQFDYALHASPRPLAREHRQTDGEELQVSSKSDQGVHPCPVGRRRRNIIVGRIAQNACPVLPGCE